jgi:hypothetical protein
MQTLTLKPPVNEHLNWLNSEKLDAETAAFEQKHPWLKKHYLKQFIAMHNGEVVDSDADFEPLCLRVQAKFGDVVVLIRQVHDSLKEEWRIRGVRWEVF